MAFRIRGGVSPVGQRLKNASIISACLASPVLFQAVGFGYTKPFGELRVFSDFPTFATTLIRFFIAFLFLYTWDVSNSLSRRLGYAWVLRLGITMPLVFVPLFLFVYPPTGWSWQNYLVLWFLGMIAGSFLMSQMPVGSERKIVGYAMLGFSVFCWAKGLPAYARANAHILAPGLKATFPPVSGDGLFNLFVAPFVRTSEFLVWWFLIAYTAVQVYQRVSRWHRKKLEDPLEDLLR